MEELNGLGRERGRTGGGKVGEDVGELLCTRSCIIQECII